VQASLDSYKNFCAALKDFLKDDPDSRVARFARHIQANFVVWSGPGFVSWWLEEIRGQIEDWTKFRGSPQSLEFGPTSGWLSSMGWNWAMDWCGDSEVWDQLLETIHWF
jgi:hypothetical protein